MNLKPVIVIVLATFAVPAWGYQSKEIGANSTPPPLVHEGRYSTGTLGSLNRSAPTIFKPDASYGIKGSWPLYPATLAPGKGLSTVQSYCSICHSTTYITNQPPLPPKKWAGEVHKMLRTYGAGHYIPPDKVAAIIHYLQANYTPETINHALPATSAISRAGVPGAVVAPPGPHSAGAALFRQNCLPCHQANGQGIAGAFPPLAGHLPDVLAAGGGHEYLAEAVLFGLQGPITVNGQSYNGSMPVWSTSLTDKQIADVLNYALAAWNNNQQLSSAFKAYSARDIATERRKTLTPAEVHNVRGKLDGLE